MKKLMGAEKFGYLGCSLKRMILGDDGCEAIEKDRSIEAEALTRQEVRSESPMKARSEAVRKLQRRDILN